LPAWSANDKSSCLASTGQPQACLEIVGQPSVVDGQVTLQLKAAQANGQAINNLDAEDFTIKVDGTTIQLPPKSFVRPGEKPSSIRIVMLLDYSGSMNEVDGKGEKKFLGAVQGIEAFINGLESSPGDIKISIVPFGVPSGPPLCNDYKMVDRLLRQETNRATTNQEVLNQFYPVNSPELKIYLISLKEDPQSQPCPNTATNLYEALATTLEFLADRSNSELYPSNGSDQPRLFVVLLSDGFNTIPFDPSYNNQEDVLQRCNKAHLEKLESEYLTNPIYSGISVYTLGYGKSQIELATDYKLLEKKGKRRATCEDVQSDNQEPSQTYPVPAREFLDEDALQKIAKLMNGFFGFSQDTEKIVQSFENVKNSILGQYEISYHQPNDDKGSAHQVTVTAMLQGQTLSDTAQYSISTLGYAAPGLSTRLGILATFSFLFVGLGILPFSIWAKRLQEEG
jgi:hypothetical protein